MVDKLTASVYSAYAKFFIEGYAKRMLIDTNFADGTNAAYLATYVSNRLRNMIGEGVDVTHPNTFSLFISECVDLAIRSGRENPESYDVWDWVSELDSPHHDEILSAMNQEVQNFSDAIRLIIGGNVASDVKQTLELIELSVKNRVNYDTMGVTVEDFTWGVLADGRWVNNAITIAQLQWNIFHDNRPVTAYYAEIIKVRIRERLNFATDTDFTSHLDEDGMAAATVADLYRASSAWIEGYDDITRVAASVQKASQFITSYDSICEKVRTSEFIEEEQIEELLERLAHVKLLATMALVGYEALRQTLYRDSLILNLKKDESGDINVCVNADLMRQYTSNGGDEQELARFATWLTRRESVFPRDGFTLTWVESVRDNVNSDIYEQSEHRTAELDLQVQSETLAQFREHAGGLILSYLEDGSLTELPVEYANAIGDVAGSISSETGSSAYDGLMTLVIKALNNEFISSIYESFRGHASAEDETEKANALALAVADVAINDALVYFQ
jgi:hypothetical protein